MQVSWIDPEEIRSLLMQIEGPRAAPTQSAWETHTLPVVAVSHAPVADLLSPAQVAAPPPREPDPPLAEDGPRPGQLWALREQLRTLREKADDSGMLGTSAPAPVAEPAPLEELPVDRTDPSDQTDLPLEPAELPPAGEEVPMEISAAARAAMEELLSGIGPQQIAVPSALGADLPQPMPPPVQTAPLAIEYSGPPPRGQDYEPLFGSYAEPAPVPETTHEPEAEPAPEPQLSLPQSGISDRIAALARWATDRLNTEDVLLVDDFGDLLWGGRAQSPLVLAAMMAWHSSQRTSAEAATQEMERIDREVSAGRWLTVVPARTKFGTVSLAAIREAKLDDEEVSAVRKALILAVEGMGK